ncbi:hypothetical protein AAFP35_26215 [Gordonia sp. CPCC 206044]|uniref:hypothetical protein n=1 Tax=Gordonia sp. CPCC 206044 TaxID=3140793 RepID=UPI003AF34F2B
MREQVGRTPRGQRSFTLEYKIEFLQLWDECRERGSKVRLLREHGLGSSTVERWIRSRERGEFEASMVAAATKGKAQSMDNRDRAELARLRAENERLKTKVAQAEAAQEVLGKAFELLEGITKGSAEPETEIPPALMSTEQYRQWLQRRGLS